MVLGEFAKDILDQVYELEGIEYFFDIGTSSLFMRKLEEGKVIKLGELSIDGMTNNITFHKNEKDDGFMRKPVPSWGIHKHLVDVRIIKYIEYRTETKIYRIGTSQIPFLSCHEGVYQGEPKYYVPLKEWTKIDLQVKTDKDPLTKLLERKFHPSWIPMVKEEWDKPYFKTMLAKIKVLRSKGVKVLPAQDNVFEAFRLTGLDEVKVVILGQDPYPDPRHPHGLSFSTKSMQTPASLRNIYEEIKRTEEGFKRSDNDLTDWALQGVFLLNSILTVNEGQPASHKGLDWLRFTGRAIKEISLLKRPVVWMLWGNYAQSLYDTLAYKNKEHLVLKAGHPSPLSVRLFKNCGHFEQCRLYLEKNNIPIIKW